MQSSVILRSQNTDDKSPYCLYMNRSAAVSLSRASICRNISSTLDETVICSFRNRCNTPRDAPFCSDPGKACYLWAVHGAWLHRLEMCAVYLDFWVKPLIRAADTTEVDNRALTYAIALLQFNLFDRSFLGLCVPQACVLIPCQRTLQSVQPCKYRHVVSGLCFDSTFS